MKKILLIAFLVFQFLNGSAQIKISQLPALVGTCDTCKIPAVKSGVTVKATGAQLTPGKLNISDTSAMLKTSRTKGTNDIDGGYILSWQTSPRIVTGVTTSSDSLYSGTGSAYTNGNYNTTASNEWEQEIVFSPTSTISGTVAIVITDNAVLGSGDCIGSINLATSTISITNGGSTWTQTASVTAVTAADVIRMRIIFWHNTLNFIYENVTKNEVRKLNKILAFGYLSGAGLGLTSHTVGKPGITFAGVTSIKIFDWKFKDNSRGQVAWIGQSIGEGYAASAWNKTYVYKVDSASSTKIALYAKAGMAIYDLVVNRAVDNIILSNPSVVVLDGLWFNDGISGQSLANTFSRMRFIRGRLAAHKISVIWLGPTIATGFATSINDSIQAVYPNDPFWNLNSFMSGSYLAADGAHPNDLGHQEVADSLMIRLPFIIGAVPNGKLLIATGTNTSIGTATLSSGTVTVSTTAVTASSKIFLQLNTPSGTLAISYSVPVGSIVASTSFVINAVDAAGAVLITDNSTINWWIVN